MGAFESTWTTRRIVMSAIQKESWGFVVAFAIALVVFLILIPLIGIKVAWGVLGLFCLGGLAPLIFRKKRNVELVASDERDKMIAEKATKAGGIGAFQIMLLACMIPWGIYQYQGKEVIGIVILPFVVFSGMIALWLTRAIAILVFYGRERNDGQN